MMPPPRLRQPAKPAFQGPARLEPLSKSEAVMELLHHFQGGPGSALLREEFGRSAARFYWEMTGLVAQATCYRLAVGHWKRWPI